VLVTTLFIDESKSNGYTVVTSAVLPGELVRMRKAVRGLTLRGQRRVHFTKESDSRRRLILSEFERLGVRSHVYVVRGRSEAEARELCLRAVAVEAATSGATAIVLEADESLVAWDRRVLYRELGVLGLRDRVTYRHEAAHAEPLLCVPDGIAWSFARGGDWRRRIQPMVVGTERLS